MKSVLKGEKSGISKKINTENRGFFKYHYLEQFEDALENAVFNNQINKDNLQFAEIDNPFQYEFKILENNKSKVINADLIETFNYLLGIFVEKIYKIRENGRDYIIITGTIDEVHVGVVWRSVIAIDLELDKKIIEENLDDVELDILFVNGSSSIENAKPIERELNHLLGS